MEQQNKPWPKIDWDKIEYPIKLTEEDCKQPDNWWVKDGYLYGTGKYKEIIQKMIEDGTTK